MQPLSSIVIQPKMKLEKWKTHVSLDQIVQKLKLVSKSKFIYEY